MATFKYKNASGQYVTMNYRDRTPKASVSTVNAVAEASKSIRKETILSSNDIAPVVFGRDRFFAKPWNAFAKDDILYVPYLVAWGGPPQGDYLGGSGARGISAYNNVYVDGVDINETDGFIDSGGEIEYHYGRNGVNQPLSTFLAEAVTGFTNRYDGFAYIVLKVPVGISNGFPRVEVDIDGLKIRRRSANYPFVETGATPSGTNLVPNSANPMLWTVQNGATHQDTGNNIGFFQETTVTSGGSTGAKTRIIAGATVGAFFYGITIYYKAGTSGKVRFQVLNQTKNVSSIISGDIGSLPTQGTNPTTSGTFTVLSDHSLGAYRVFRAVYTPLSYLDTVYFYMGPQSSVSGENVFVYGAQVDNITYNFFAVPVFTDNPIDIHAHLLEQSGSTLDANSVQEASSWNNEVLPYSTSPRRSMGFTIDSVGKISSILEFFRAYTGCSLTYDGGVVYYLKQEARVTSHTFNDNHVERINIGKSKSKEVPTRYVVSYTDKENDFAVEEAIVVNPDSTLPVRISKISFLGCNNFEFAKREAVERYNRSTLSDLRVNVQLFDEGIEVLVGEVCSITYSDILTNKLMEVVSVSERSAGYWNVELEEYDPLFFSTDVESSPSFPDTQLPVHAPPPAVTGLTVSEEIYQRKNGEYDNRFRINWTKSISAYTRNYVVRVKKGGVVIASISETGLETAYGPLEEDVPYQIEVVAVTSLYEGAVASVIATPNGKTIPPLPVTVFDVFEVGGQVRLSWGAAVDLDIVDYEIQYGPANVVWDDDPASAQILNRVSSLRYVTNDIPIGTYDFMIKPRDSVGLYPTTGGDDGVGTKRVNSVEVTLDEKSLLVGSGTYPDLTTDDLLVHRTKEVRCSTFEIIYTNTSSQTWTALFGGSQLPAAGAIASKQAVPTSNFRHSSAVVTFATDISGNWRSTHDATVYGGTVATKQGLKLSAAASFTLYDAASVQTKARNTFQQYVGLGLVRIDLSKQIYRVDAVTRNETKSDEAAIGGKTVELEGSYSAFKVITATPIGNGALAAYCVIDAVDFTATPNTFDVYMFDPAGVQLSGDGFVWRFEGV